MDRRQFMQSVAGATAVTAIPATYAAPSQAPTPAGREERMKVGCQRWGSSAAHMPFLVRNGVTHICISPAKSGPDRIWTAETCRAARERVVAAGLQPASMYWGVPIDVLRPGRRDGAIERCRKQIVAAGKGGIPCLAYNLHVRVWRARTGRVPGRGGAEYSQWDLAQVTEQKGKPNLGPVSADEMWDRITYFLQKVVPVAHEAKVKLACHPPDPPMPRDHQWKIAQVLDTVEGLKRFVSIQDSPCHGLTFCQGCIWEMLPQKEKPEGLYDAIRWFGSRGKIHQAHFRNLRGGREEFIEVFHDEGEIDMARALATYRETGYAGMLMPDHVPHHESEGSQLQHFAFAYGYIKGLIDATYAQPKPRKG